MQELRSSRFRDAYGVQGRIAFTLRSEIWKRESIQRVARIVGTDRLVLVTNIANTLCCSSGTTTQPLHAAVPEGGYNVINSSEDECPRTQSTYTSACQRN